MPTTTPRLTGADELVDCCGWVADAHAADDPQQVVAAQCELYRLLADSGWVPSQRSPALLRLRDAVVEHGISELVEPQFP